jgi:signal transduction histidine kinase
MQGTSIDFKTVSADEYNSRDTGDRVASQMKQRALPKQLIGDKLRLQQILINLIKNALKFCLRGKVNILMTFDAPQEMLKVDVVDNGKGIKHEEMSKLFSLFGKLRRTAELNSEGIGMGLMIC